MQEWLLRIALWLVPKRIKLARRRYKEAKRLKTLTTVARASIVFLLVCGMSGCRRFDPFWIEVGDLFGIESEE